MAEAPEKGLGVWETSEVRLPGLGVGRVERLSGSLPRQRKRCSTVKSSRKANTSDGFSSSWGKIVQIDHFLAIRN